MSKFLKKKKNYRSQIQSFTKANYEIMFPQYLFTSRGKSFTKAGTQHDIINRSIKQKRNFNFNRCYPVYIYTYHIHDILNSFAQSILINAARSVHLRWSGEKCQKFVYALRHVGRMVNMTRKEGKDEGSWCGGLYRDEKRVQCILEIDAYTRLLPHCIRICPISWMYVLHVASFCRAWPMTSRMTIRDLSSMFIANTFNWSFYNLDWYPVDIRFNYEELFKKFGSQRCELKNLHKMMIFKIRFKIRHVLCNNKFHKTSHKKMIKIGKRE